TASGPPCQGLCFRHLNSHALHVCSLLHIRPQPCGLGCTGRAVLWEGWAKAPSPSVCRHSLPLSRHTGQGMAPQWPLGTQPLRVSSLPHAPGRQVKIINIFTKPQQRHVNCLWDILFLLLASQPLQLKLDQGLCNVKTT
uniref:Uncharacterized protein n=1 Tax=Cyanistes caeruleus TaxID=156563 RepID=A0A8C0TYU9_CYACU